MVSVRLNLLKYIFTIPVFVSFLTGIETEKQYHDGPLAGGIFGNYIIIEVLKAMSSHGIREECYFLRTSNKAEIDLIVKVPNKTQMIEIK